MSEKKPYTVLDALKASLSQRHNAPTPAPVKPEPKGCLGIPECRNAGILMQDPGLLRTWIHGEGCPERKPEPTKVEERCTHGVDRIRSGCASCAAIESWRAESLAQAAPKAGEIDWEEDFGPVNFEDADLIAKGTLENYEPMEVSDEDLNYARAYLSLKASWDMARKILPKVGLMEENATLRQSLAEAAKVLSDLMEQHPKRRGWTEPPGHSHSVPGIWDDDNEDKSGTACAWCATWWKARAILAKEKA
jgi:hypothetical protein